MGGEHWRGLLFLCVLVLPVLCSSQSLITERLPITIQELVNSELIITQQFIIFVWIITQELIIYVSIIVEESLSKSWLFIVFRIAQEFVIHPHPHLPRMSLIMASV